MLNAATLQTRLEILDATLECEKASYRREGGSRFLWIPFFFTIVWHEQERVEKQGHDTDVPAPICICRPCQDAVRRKPSLLKLAAVLAGLLMLITVAAGVFDLAIGSVAAMMGILGIGARPVHPACPRLPSARSPACAIARPSSRLSTDAEKLPGRRGRPSHQTKPLGQREFRFHSRRRQQLLPI